MGEEQIKAEALRAVSAFQILPRLVVFDLDYTLWPFWCFGQMALSQSHYPMETSLHFCECHSSKPSLYPQAKSILNALKDKGINMAVASRTPTPDIARDFLNKLGIASYFTAMEIYPSRTPKTGHFQKIQQKTGVPFKSMLFFDDEYPNIEAVSNMGVTSILVNRGVNLDALKKGLRCYSQVFSSTDSNRQSQDV